MSSIAATPSFFLLQCPQCGSMMKYHTPTKILADKRKRCVYCGRSFKARSQLRKEL